MNIVLVAQEAAGVRALRLVAASPHRLVAVLTNRDARGATVTDTAAELGVPTLPAGLVLDPGYADELRRQRVDVLRNAHSLYLINAEVLAAPRVGGFNLHPGPLPGYAGLDVPSWAIYHGEASHGVTLHWLAPKADTGPIAYRASFPLTDRDTGSASRRDAVSRAFR